MSLLDNYKIASALLKGVAHQKSNTKCQDAVLTTRRDKHIFLGLADGAGSKQEAYSAAWFILHALEQEFNQKLDLYLDSLDISKKIPPMTAPHITTAH